MLIKLAKTVRGINGHTFLEGSVVEAHCANDNVMTITTPDWCPLNEGEWEPIGLREAIDEIQGTMDG